MVRAEKGVQARRGMLMPRGGMLGAGLGTPSPGSAGSASRLPGGWWPVHFEPICPVVWRWCCRFRQFPLVIAPGIGLVEGGCVLDSSRIDLAGGSGWRWLCEADGGRGDEFDGLRGLWSEQREPLTRLPFAVMYAMGLSAAPGPRTRWLPARTAGRPPLTLRPPSSRPPTAARVGKANTRAQTLSTGLPSTTSSARPHQPASCRIEMGCYGEHQ